LRFNPGGLLSSAIAVCDMFVPEGRIVSTKGRNTPERVWDAQPGEKFDDFPMVILVNRYSASASEIVSACLQDHNRAVVIGERSWGKGSVQNVVELEEGHSALKLTTATYTRPNGHNIHRFPDAKETDEWGVKPNDGLEVKLNNLEMGDLLTYRHDRDIVQSKSIKETPVVPKSDVIADQEKKADDSTPKSLDAKNTSSAGATDEKSTATSDSHTPAADAAEKKPAEAKPAKFVDRQLQKGLEYLTTEMARAK
jgi:carboxyl-terminal processing protease